MINKNNIMVLDFETGDNDPYTCPVIQLAALVVNPKTFVVYEDGIFNSMSKPIHMNGIKQEALDVNKKTIEQIENAPDESVVWNNFVNFVNKFKVENSDWGLPILAGHNIVGFDKIILDRLCRQYQSKICHPFHVLDTIHLSFCWFESRKDILRYNLTYLRTKFGLTQDNAHDALKDCYDTLSILTRYMKLFRTIAPKIQLPE